MQLNNLLISKGEKITPQMRSGLPVHFTNPFSYSPHQLVKDAANTVIKYLDNAHSYLKFLLKEDGKMFGVLVVESPTGELGFLAAYSGAHEELKETGYFVPPVYDLLSPDSFYKEEEQEISRLNDLIRAHENDRYLFIHDMVTEEIKQSYLEEIANLKKIYAEGKVKRDSMRKEMLDEQQLQDIIRESQFQKAQIKRAEKKMKEELAQRDAEQAASYARIEELKVKRKELSGPKKE